MKTTKYYTIILAATLLLTLVACTPTGNMNNSAPTPPQSESPTTPASGSSSGNDTTQARAVEHDSLIGYWTYTHTIAENSIPFVVDEFQYIWPSIEVRAQSMAMTSWDETELFGNIRITLYESVLVGTVNLIEPHSYSLNEVAVIAEGNLEYTDRRYFLQYNPDDESLRYDFGVTDVYHYFARTQTPSIDSITIIPYEGQDSVEFNVEETELDLMYWDLSNEKIIPLKYMTNLTYLNLNGTGISDISPLKDLKNLRVLSLSNNQINDFSVLEGLTNLTWLDLQDTGIDNLDILKGLTNLERLTLERNPLTQQQIGDLQSDLPNCIISYDKAEG